MKTSILAMAIVSALGYTCVVPTVMASDGTITISGLVTATTCTVAVNGGSSGNGTVVLPTISNQTLSADGVTGGLTSFSIALSGTSCTDGSNVKAVFDGGNVDYSTGQLTAGTGTATNVQIGLTNSDGTAITIGDPTTMTGGVVSSNAVTLNYGAQYVAHGGQAGVGTVNTNVTYSIAYN